MPVSSIFYIFSVATLYSVRICQNRSKNVCRLLFLIFLICRTSIFLPNFEWIAGWRVKNRYIQWRPTAFRPPDLWEIRAAIARIVLWVGGCPFISAISIYRTNSSSCLGFNSCCKLRAICFEIPPFWRRRRVAEDRLYFFVIARNDAFGEPISSAIASAIFVSNGESISNELVEI